MSLEAVIFDLDGTLIDFHKNYLLDQAHGIFPQLGYPNVSRSDIEEYFVTFNFFGFIEESLREEFSKEFWTFFDWESFPEAVPLEGSLELLASLREQNKKLAIATARLSTPEKVKKFISQTGFLPYIDFVACRESDEVHWTDKRQMLRSVVASLAVDPKDCLMVGDTPPDIISAKDIGIGKTIAVLSGGLRTEVFDKVNPCKVLNSVAELKDETL